MTRAGLRKAESLAEIDVLRVEIAAWRDRWDDDAAVDAHQTQLARLADVLGALLADIDAWARAEFDRAAGAGAAYEVGRKADELALHVRRLWRWYADKLDGLGGALAAGGGNHDQSNLCAFRNRMTSSSSGRAPCGAMTRRSLVSSARGSAPGLEPA